MEKITPGKVVSLIYDLYAIDDDGKQKLMHQVEPSAPEKIIFGVTPGVIVPLEKALDGQEKGFKFNVVANPNEAFGMPNPEAIMDLDREYFEVDGKFDDSRVKVGCAVPMLLADGSLIDGMVLDITDTHVRMDFNHPLAGKIVRLKGSVLDVRDATEEELHLAMGHGCGCHGGCGCNDGGCNHDADNACGCHSEGGCCGGCQ